jgi:pilus assembly protein Flp/PilA
MHSFLRRLWHEEDGQDLVEYGLLVTLIGLSTIVSMKTVASAISTFFSSAASSLTSTS